MKPLRPKAVLERGAVQDLWRNTLSQIPTFYGRLVYLSSLRNADTGIYEHHGMSVVFGENEAEKALRACHDQVFGEWLELSSEQRAADLVLYLTSVGANRKLVIENWIRNKPYQMVIPISAEKPHRMQFLSGVNEVLTILRSEYAVSVRDPDA